MGSTRFKTIPMFRGWKIFSEVGMDAKKPKGFGKFDAMMRKLVKLPASAVTPRPKPTKRKRK